MKEILSTIMIAFMLFNVTTYSKIAKLPRKGLKSRLKMTVFGMDWILFSELVIINARDRKLAYIAFTSYYIALAWFVYLILRFCVLYAGAKEVPYYKSVFFWITFADAFEIIRAYFDEKLFTITHVRWLEHIVWASRPFSAFNICTGISVTTIVLAMFVLIYASIKSAKIFRPRYLSIIGVLIVSLSIYIFLQIKESPYFFSVIIFALSEIVIVYMSVFYAPKKLRQRALTFAAEQFNDGMVLYDSDSHLQFVTDEFIQKLGITDSEALNDEEGFWNDYFADTISDSVWNGRVKKIAKAGKDYYYEIEYKHLEDNGIKVGTVYWVHDITESVENYNDMIHRANYDELTGLYNEKHFHEECRALLDMYPDLDFVMICSNAEKLKIFSDLFGREKSQEYIIKTAEYMKNHLKKKKLCRYGRIGGNSFYLMLDKAEFDEEDLIESVDEVAKEFNTRNYNLTVNLGVYEIKNRSHSMSTICNRASMACDAAKGDYNKRVVWFDENVQQKSMLEERYNAELTNAIETGQIRIFLQPQVDKDGKLIGAEALARWIHPEDGIIPPINFIPFLEKNGRITELDMCIWRQACEKLKEWKDMGREDLYISINISAKDLYSLDIYEVYTNFINEYGINAKNLKLEITESSVVNDIKQHITLIEKLQKSGFEVEMDDFGSAYSSFNMLKDVCVDVLKIDMKFLGQTQNIERSRSILKSIVTLSKELGMKTVAEGVETKEQFEFLKEAGCDVYQGYYFSKPMAVADFEKEHM